jgi:hypothetical protein
MPATDPRPPSGSPRDRREARNGEIRVVYEGTLDPVGTADALTNHAASVIIRS